MTRIWADDEGRDGYDDAGEQSSSADGSDEESSSDEDSSVEGEYVFEGFSD
jgi:hypothetical protein